MAEIDPQAPSDDEYDSEADLDFNPETAEAHQIPDLSSSDDKDEAAGAGSRKRPKTVKNKDNTALDFDNSGDEATVSKAHRKRRKLNTAGVENEDEGGDGGFVKTRAQRSLEQQEKKGGVSSGQASVDVDALWSQMLGSTTEQAQAKSPTASYADKSSTAVDLPTSQISGDRSAKSVNGSDAANTRLDEPAPSHNESMITIKRKIEFAGQVTEEERTVPASSAEAKLYLEEQKHQNAEPNSKPGLRRPTKRKSAFDRPQSDSAAQQAGKKLNTIEKSKLDWAAQVDKEGLADELTEYSRGKTDYLGRQDFLSRTGTQ